MRALLLDFRGTIAALIVGLAIIICSKEYALQNFILLLIFLVISVIVTKYKHIEKRARGLYEHERGWQNVISNGLVPVLCVVMYAFTGMKVLLSMYICAIAAAAADKFGSELGVLSGKPISLKNFKRVPPGVSGAISLLGTLMSFIGALAIGTIAYFLYRFDPFVIFTVAVIGFVGGFADTLAGILEEEGVGNKSTSNIIGIGVGAIIGYLIKII
jgi:uncharacterized protein (TIGR00297 family)